MKKLLGNFNWPLFASMLALIAIGALTIRSAGAVRSAAFHDMWLSTLQTSLFGLAVYLTLAFSDYRNYFSWFALPVYAFSLVLLVLVLLVGKSMMGGTRWLWFFQPSEIAKPCVLVFLAEVFGRREELFPGRFRFGGFLFAAAAAGLPALLIVLEPDLGTALALAPAVVAVLLAAGVWRKGLVVLLAVGMLAATAVLTAVYEAEKPGVDDARRERILEYVPLKPHQVKRVKTFLFPESDQMASGYNLRQARMAIGSGGLWGKGYGKAETNQLKYLPPAVSMNDFIFCVWAEEQGYMGSLLLLALFGVLALSCVHAAYVAADFRGRLFAIGAATLVFAHVYVNIAMSIGLVPITGLPLPFISLGRTFLITMMSALGIVQSISIHREEIT